MHPSINPMSIALRMDWKHGKKDECLLNHNKEIARDVCGRQMLNNGDGNNPTSKDQFLTTITKLHTTRDQSGNHSSPSESCFDNYFTKGNKRGCMCHVGAPRMLHSGNLRSSAIVKSAVKNIYIHVVDLILILPHHLSKLKMLMMNYYQDCAPTCVIFKHG